MKGWRAQIRLCFPGNWVKTQSVVKGRFVRVISYSKEIFYLFICLLVYLVVFYWYRTTPLYLYLHALKTFLNGRMFNTINQTEACGILLSIIWCNLSECFIELKEWVDCLVNRQKINPFILIFSLSISLFVVLKLSKASYASTYSSSSLKLYNVHIWNP